MNKVTLVFELDSHLNPELFVEQVVYVVQEDYNDGAELVDYEISNPWPRDPWEPYLDF